MKFITSLVLLATATTAARADDPKPTTFTLQFSRDLAEKPFTGRVYVLLTKKEPTVLTADLNWFKPEPAFARDVRDWKPGEGVVFDAKAMCHPASLDRVAAGPWYTQAVMDYGRGISFSAAEGNLFSKPVKVDIGSGQSVPLKLDQIYHSPAFTETDTVKLVAIESKLLSEFHGHPVRLRAGVALPASYGTSKDKRYPVIYSIPGFGGNHFGAFGAARRKATQVAGQEFIYVVLDPACPQGHTVFADSENNGPWGRALVEELIPAVESKYRAIGRPAARFVTGHSSGGWSSLWLQVTHPEFFGGGWSTAPDPVDFRDFQRIDIYKDDNLFTDGRGTPRPLARRGLEPVLFFKGFSDMETIMGHGGQLASFEAVFSPKGSDGRPKLLWDRQTGAIDHAVARTWEKYDIRLVLEAHWLTLGPKLAGKIHVYTGDRDTFYLEGATRLLGQSLKALGSDARVELIAGKDHGTLMDEAMRRRIEAEMAAQFLKSSERQ